jgi:hypothetical protein
MAKKSKLNVSEEIADNRSDQTKSKVSKKSKKKKSSKLKKESQIAVQESPIESKNIKEQSSSFQLVTKLESSQINLSTKEKWEKLAEMNIQQLENSGVSGQSCGTIDASIITGKLKSKRKKKKKNRSETLLDDSKEQHSISHNDTKASSRPNNLTEKRVKDDEVESKKGALSIDSREAVDFQGDCSKMPCKKTSLKEQGTQTKSVIHESTHVDINGNSLERTISCEICFDVLMVPHTTQCGHTFCYSCINTWINQERINPTCPKCRSKQEHPPVLNHALELCIQLLVPMLWGPEEQKGIQSRLEESKTQFKSISNPWNWNAGNTMFFDASDNVHRCGNCGFEVENGYCETCNMHFFNQDSNFDEYDYDEDFESDASEGYFDPEFVVEDYVDDVAFSDEDFEHQGHMVNDPFYEYYLESDDNYQHSHLDWNSASEHEEDSCYLSEGESRHYHDHFVSNVFEYDSHESDSGDYFSHSGHNAFSDSENLNYSQEESNDDFDDGPRIVEIFSDEENTDEINNAGRKARRDIQSSSDSDNEVGQHYRTVSGKIACSDSEID